MIFLGCQIKHFKTLTQIKHLNNIIFYNTPKFEFSSETKKQVEEFDEFGRKYPPHKGEYLVPSITTDAVVIRKRKNLKTKFDILMITRKGEPFKDHLAFPGGFLDYNEEPSKGCLRELKEETGLDGLSCELLTVKGEPQRDPREHIVSIFYKVEVDNNQKPIANDDAAKAEFYPFEQLLESKDKIAFDHYDVLLALQKSLQKSKKKI